MGNLQNKWYPKYKEPLKERIKWRLLPQEPLKLKLERIGKAINSQVSSLTNTLNKLMEKDSQLFKRIVEAIKRHDMDQASAYSNELVEIRKTIRNTMQARMILEQILLRIETVRDMGDVAISLTPLIPILKGIQNGVASIIPEANSEFNEIDNTLSEILNEAGIQDLSLEFEPLSEDAKRILNEATMIAEHKVSEDLPKLFEEGKANG